MPAGRECRGQMTVELAVLVPVTIVVALIVFNLGRFIGLCVQFDRVSMDAVLAAGVSPSGAQTRPTATHDVQANIQEAMGPSACKVSVSASEVSGSSGDATFTLSPFLTRFDCVMEYRPWPRSFVLVGVPFTPPGLLRHERSIVVDRYRPGVVM